MSSKQTRSDIDTQDWIVAAARRNQDQWEKTYRAQALKMYPWIFERWTQI